MPDQTTPATGVAGGTLTVEQRLASYYGGGSKPAEEPAEAPQEAVEPPQQDATPDEPVEQSEGPADELGPDDIPDEGAGEAQPSTDAFEIVHNGQARSVSRDELISLAQKGFDYTEKTQQLATARKQLGEMLERSQQIEQMQPLLIKESAAVSAFEQQLASWQNVDWVKLATDEPLEYPRYRAQYEQLLGGYNAAQRAYQQKLGAVQQQKAQIAHQLIQQEMGKLNEFLPGIADPKKFADVKATIADYGEADGYSLQELESVSDARYIRTLWKAAQYDRLVKSKAEKTKQMRAAPPTVKPGALGQTSSAEQQKTQKMRHNLKKSGDWRDAAALLARLK